VVASSLLPVARAAAQTAPDSALARPAAPPDSLTAPPASSIREVRGGHVVPASADTVRTPAVQHWSDQPRFVMLRSLIIPGWGQYHNKAYVKAGVIAALEGLLIYGVISDKADLDKLHQAAIEAQQGGDPSQANDAVNAYNDRLDRYNRRQWLLGGVVVYSLLDAYVDAHFKNFDVEFRKAPPQTGGGSSGGERLTLRWTF
jgi:hypothetical protein